MPRRRSRSKGPVSHIQRIDGRCTADIDQWKDPGLRPFVLVKFSMVKVLSENEKQLCIQGSEANLGNWRGLVRARESPPSSGHHVAYVALPKNLEVTYQWILVGMDGCTVKEKELPRSVQLTDNDLMIQNYFKVYTDILPDTYQPDCDPDGQLLVPVAFATRHQVARPGKECLAVTGNTPELGRWRAINSRVMFQITEDLWCTTIYVMKGIRFRYKFAVIENSKKKGFCYGEKREHRVDLRNKEVEHVKGSLTDLKTELDNRWVLKTNSDISLQHIEQLSMGSVTSDASLGSNRSISSRLSEIADEDEILDSTSHTKVVSEEQQRLLEELKSKLSSAEGPHDCGNIARDPQSASWNGSNPFQQTSIKLNRCREWLEQQEDHLANNDNGTDIKECSHISGRVQDLELEKSDAELNKGMLENENQPAGRYKPSHESVGSTQSNMAPTEEGLGGAAVARRVSEIPLTGLHDSFSTSNGTDSLTALKKGAGKAPDQKVSFLQGCASIKTSTVYLPSLETKHRTSDDIARMVVGQIPWIRDLPKPLACRVLNSLGLLDAGAQETVADCLSLLKVGDQN